MTEDGLQGDLNARIVALIGDGLGFPYPFHIFVRRAAIGQYPAIGRVNQRVGPDIPECQRQFSRLLEINAGICRRDALSPAEIDDLAAGHHPQIIRLNGWRLVRKQFAHLLPASQCLTGIVGADPHRSAHIELGRLERISGLLPMISQQGSALLRVIGKELFDRLRHRRVKFATPFVQQRSIGDFLDQGMAKCEKPLLEGRDIIEKLGSPQMPDRFGKLGRRQIGDQIQHRRRNLATDNRRDLEHLFCRFIQTVDTSRDHGLHRRRQRHRIDAALQPIRALFAFEISPLDQRIHQFFQEERISLRALDDVPAQKRQRRVAAKMIAQYRLRLGRSERQAC